MTISFIRTIILYISVMVALRIMGKRQIGELQPSELVITIMLGDLASVPMQETGIPLLNGLIPIFTLVVIELTFSLIGLKSKRARAFISGKPSIVIKNGQIDVDELRRLRFNIDDLLEELHDKDFSDISDVETAVIDTNGILCVIPKAEKKPLTPSDLNIAATQDNLPFIFISDGRLIKENLDKSGLSESELKKMLKKQKINDYKSVLLATYSKNKGLQVQKKKEGSK